MKIFIDFEATGAKEIVSVGAVAENGNTYYSLVKPEISKLTQYLSDLIGLRNEDLDNAPKIENVFSELYYWCINLEPHVSNWEFYSYGSDDIDFIRASKPFLNSDESIIIASLMIANMIDYSKTAQIYFQGTTSLIKAFNYINNIEKEQIHNALDDAKMLADVFDRIDGEEPLNVCPFVNHITANNYTFPSGKFYCKGTGKNSKEREFLNIQDAIEWIIDTKINKNSRDKIHRDKMAIKIMKAIKKNDIYMQYKWRRIK